MQNNQQVLQALNQKHNFLSQAYSQMHYTNIQKLHLKFEEFKNTLLQLSNH